jgi:hypothetical protein
LRSRFVLGQGGHRDAADPQFFDPKGHQAFQFPAQHFFPLLAVPRQRSGLGKGDAEPAVGEDQGGVFHRAGEPLEEVRQGLVQLPLLAQRTTQQTGLEDLGRQFHGGVFQQPGLTSVAYGTPIGQSPRVQKEGVGRRGDGGGARQALNPQR